MNRPGSFYDQQTKSASAWRPILEDETADRARSVIREVSDALRDATSTAAEADEIPPGNVGQADLALLFGYLDLEQPGESYDAIAIKHPNQAAALLSTVDLDACLYSGLTGIAWVINHLQHRLSCLEVDDTLEDLDQVLLKLVSRSPWLGNFDLIGGLVGLGVYFLERLPADTAAASLKQIVDRLGETGKQEGDGISWHTTPSLLALEEKELFPHGYYDLGVAHGAAGIIAFLGQACAAGIAPQKSRALLEGAVCWLLDQKLPSGATSVFPGLLDPGKPPESSRIAWCYGDLGIATTLLYAARCTAQPDWEREAVTLALTAAERPMELSDVVDAGICHGACGNAHLFNRLFQATGATRLGDAARFWFEQTLRMREFGQGVAGYTALPLGTDPYMRWIRDRSHITGVAGIALTLISAVSTVEPSWDAILLASIPPKRTTSHSLPPQA